MNNRLNARLNAFLAVSTLVVLVSGCGGGSSGGDSSSNSSSNSSGGSGGETDRTITSGPVEVYRSSFLELNYPADWSLVANGGAVVLLDPDQSELGGNPNCTVSSYFSPNSTLVEEADDFLDVLRESPEPQIRFITANGNPAARINGNLSILNVEISSETQVMYEEDIEIGHVVVCADTDANDAALVLSSMKLI